MIIVLFLWHKWYIANCNPNLDNLKSYKPKWLSGKTQTIRVPIAITEKVLEVAYKIDRSQFSVTSEFKWKNFNFNKNKSRDLAQKILKQRKSARISLEKFLQEVYQDKDIKLQ